MITRPLAQQDAERRRQRIEQLRTGAMRSRIGTALRKSSDSTFDARRSSSCRRIRSA